MPNVWAVLSLLPIAVGIAATSWQAPAFDTLSGSSGLQHNIE